MKDKEDNYPVFTSDKKPTVSLHRVTFTEGLNKVLKYASEEFHKKISCHSFWATFITEGIMNKIPIDVMQKAVGHQSIKSTEHWRIKERCCTKN